MKNEVSAKPMSGWRLMITFLGLWFAGWVVIGLLARVAYDMVRLGFTFFGAAPF